MHAKKPDWLKIKVRSSENNDFVENILHKYALNTVCEQAGCPNIGECFCGKTATFMILGKFCMRNCTFCQVSKDVPEAVCADEPIRVAQAVNELGLKHTVITSVTRDDLPDGGAGHFADVIKQIKTRCANVTIEVLIPDFQGSTAALRKVIDAGPDVINHNIETVPRLYSKVRPMADYSRSLALLQQARRLSPHIKTKSGIMVGLGETQQEVIQAMRDLRGMSCDILTIGQYLAPSKQHHPVIEYIHPEIFDQYKELALEMGFRYVASGPFVRSSYHAAEALRHRDDVTQSDTPG